MATGVVVGFGARFMVVVMVLTVVAMAGIAVRGAIIVPLMQSAVNHTRTHPRENAEKE